MFYVTAGAASSVLVGDTQVPPTMLRGYENGAMIVSDEVKALGYSGGAAAKAAEASVVVGDKVKKGAKVLDDKGSVAVDKGSRALGKQLGKTRGMFKAFKDEYQKASGARQKLANSDVPNDGRRAGDLLLRLAVFMGRAHAPKRI